MDLNLWGTSCRWASRVAWSQAFWNTHSDGTSQEHSRGRANFPISLEDHLTLED